MAHVEVEVDLDDLLEEIESRYNRGGIRGKSNKNQIDEFIKKMKIEIDEDLVIKSTSLIDSLKIEFITKNLQRISINDLENLIK